MNERRLEGLAQEYLVRGHNSLYQCSVCHKTGSNRDSMKMHLESMHFPTDGAYECEFCRQLFNTKQAYKKHKSNYHVKHGVVWYVHILFVFLVDNDETIRRQKQ